MISKEAFKLIVSATALKTGKSQEELALGMGYGKNYISDILSPTGKLTDKFIKAFQLAYNPISENTKEGKNEIPANKDLSDLIESNLTMSRSIEKNSNSLLDLVQMLKEKNTPVNYDEVKENQMLLLAYQKTLFHHVARLQASAEKADLSKVEIEMGKSLAQYVGEFFQTDKKDGK